MTIFPCTAFEPGGFPNAPPPLLDPARRSLRQERAASPRVHPAQRFAELRRGLPRRRGQSAGGGGHRNARPTRICDSVPAALGTGQLRRCRRGAFSGSRALRVHDDESSSLGRGRGGHRQERRNPHLRPQRRQAARGLVLAAGGAGRDRVDPDRRLAHRFLPGGRPHRRHLGAASRQRSQGGNRHLPGQPCRLFHVRVLRSDHREVDLDRCRHARCDR